MALFKFIAAIFKKIAKLFGKLGGKKSKDTGDRLPGERRIGIYGPSAVGKSVFFTMLYKACRQDREFNLAPDDPSTGKQLVNNLNTLRGGEWLPGTIEESALNFKASLRGGSQFPFSTKDYKGETVDLEQESSSKEELIRYFQNCDAILFLISPEMIADPRKCEREIISFTAMINQVTESGGKGLRIPVGLMITKADMIPGYENESHATLISRKSEYLKAKSFQEFVDGVCGQFHIARNIVFQESVRETMNKLSLFFDFLMTLSMEFQVFFISSVGHVRKEERPDGSMATRPPEDPDGIGVKTPFLWVIDTIRQREKIANFNSVRRFFFRFAMVLAIFYSIFYAWHLIPHRDSLRQMQTENWNQDRIVAKLERQATRFPVKQFGFFALPGARASDIPETSQRLHARFTAHRFISENLEAINDGETLRELADEFGTPEWRLKNPWYDLLRGAQRATVGDAVWQKVMAHNLRQGVAVRELEEEYGAQSSAAPDEIIQRCAVLAEGFIPVKGDLTSEFEDRRSEAEGICDRISRSGEEKIFLRRWDELITELKELCQFGNPPAADIQKLRDGAQQFEKDAKPSNNEDIRDLSNSADEMDGQLRLMQAALDPGNEADAVGYLREMAKNSVGVLQPLATWSRRRLADRNEGQRQQREAEIAAQITENLEAGNWPWFTSSRTARQMTNYDWLSGSRKAAMDRYQSALNEMQNGVSLTMTVISAPPGFVVVYWDPIVDDWDPNQAMAGNPIDIRWKPSEKVRIGLQKAGAARGQPCAKEGSIWELSGTADVIPCPGTGGNVATQVSFEGIDELVRTRLAAPLTEAFPE